MTEELIESFLLQRYPGNGRPQAIRAEIANACKSFVKSGLADSNFTKDLCSGSEQRFWSRVSEALLAARLKSIGLTPKEKAEKLIGSLDGTVKGYIEKGIVAPDDAYVIAVNGCQLRSGPFPELLGISQFPFAVEAVFAVGPYQIEISRDTLKQTGAGHQHRLLITKPKGSPVPAYTFLDSRFESISAIWAVDVDGTSAIGNSEPMAVVHNPNAVNPIPTGFLPAHNEYVATPIGTEEYELNRLEGNLSSGK